MDNKDFLQVSNALRDGYVTAPDFLEKLNSFGDNVNLSTVLDATFHKIANTDHSKNNNRLPISTSELPSVYQILIQVTAAHLQGKILSDNIEKSDYQLFSTLNYNFGNSLVRKTEVMPLNNDEDLKGVVLRNQLPTATAEEASNVLEAFRSKTEFLDLEDIAVSLKNKLDDFDASSNDKEIDKIVNLYKKQQAFISLNNESDNVVNYSEYEETINNNEQKISEIVKRANLNLARDEEDTPFIKVLNEIDKPSFDEEVENIKNNIKNGIKVFDRRMEISLLRGDIEEVLDSSVEPGLTISNSPDSPSINNVNKNGFTPQDKLEEYLDWEQKYQEFLKELNFKELKVFDKTKIKANVFSPNQYLSTMKLLGDSVVSLNELGNANKTLINVSPLTGTMRLGREISPESPDGNIAFKIAALNARRKGWDKVYLNHTGKDDEAIPYIKQAIRAMAEHGQYELDQIKVPKRFQALLENYRLSVSELTISDGTKEKADLEFVSVSTINQPTNEDLESKVENKAKPDADKKADEQVPNSNDVIPDESSPKNKDDVQKGNKVEDNKIDENQNLDAGNSKSKDEESLIDDHSNIPDDVIKQKGQEAPPYDNSYADIDYDDLMDSQDLIPPDYDSEQSTIKSDPKEKTLELYHHSETLVESSGGYVHKPMFEMVKDLIAQNESGYWDSISGLKSKDTPLASAIQSVKKFVEQGLASPESSELIAKMVSTGKIEKIMEKSLGRELMDGEKTVVKSHYDNISNYIQNFANRGEHEIVVLGSNTTSEIKNSPEQFEEVILNSEFKRSGDRKNEENLARYAKLKSEGKELKDIYKEIDTKRLIAEGYQLPELKKISSENLFEDDKPDANNKSSNRRNQRPSM